MTSELLQIRLGECTSAGSVREHNEDYRLWYEPGSAGKGAVGGSLYVVADGMGGYTAGDQASKIAVETTVRLVRQSAGAASDPAVMLTEALKVANRDVYEAAQFGDRAGMGTAIVCAYIVAGLLYTAHVGDSRAYLRRGATLSRLTRDHSWVNYLLAQQQITEQEAENHPQAHALLQAIGHKPEVSVDINGPIELQAGDVLALCTDGVWAPLGDQRMDDILSAHPDPQTAAEALVAMAERLGGDDNATAIVLRIEPVPAMGDGGQKTGSAHRLLGMFDHLARRDRAPGHS